MTFIWKLLLASCLGRFLVLAHAHFPAVHQRRQDAPNSSAPPRNFAVVLFRAFDMLDVFGPLSALQLQSFSSQMNLYFLAESLDPVTSEPASQAMNTYNSSFWPTVQPTHTFNNAPENIDVLIIPGGPGTRAPNLTAVTDFVSETYPKLQYLITICTGAGVAARSGVLDGRRATTNKKAWATITAYGPNVKWVSPARWVEDGNIWSSSGVSAGLDVTHALIRRWWGAEADEKILDATEYVPHPQDFDPFSAKFNITPTGN